MGSKTLSIGLALVLASSGIEGWAAFVQPTIVRYYIEPKTGKTASYVVANVPSVQAQRLAPASVAGILQRLQDPNLTQRLSETQIKQAVSFLRRYESSLEGSADPQVVGALQEAVGELSDESRDPNLTLAGLYDDLSKLMRRSEEAATHVDTVVREKDSSGRKRQVAAVGSTILGRPLATQDSLEIGHKTYRQIIYRPDPDDLRRNVIDSIIIESQKGAATEKRVVYNRKVHLLLKNLKKLYYDQTALKRKIDDTADPQTTPEARQKMREAFDAKRLAFHELKYFDGRGKKERHILDYLEELEARQKAGALDELNWKELAQVQSVVMRFYNDNQLEMMQKLVIIQLSAYFGQVTNSQPKQKKGTGNLEPTLKDKADLQQALTAFENGEIQGHSLLTILMRLSGASKLSHEDKTHIPPDLMTLASEAFAAAAYAGKAQKRAWQSGLSNEEVEAAVEESRQWLKLLQAQLQSFEMRVLAIQLGRLTQGELNDRLGLDPNDARMKAEAERLASAASTQYLPKLDEVGAETKKALLKESVAAFYLTLLNASHAYLYRDTLSERVRTLAAQAAQMKALYLSREFDTVKDTRTFQDHSTTVLEKLEGSAYQYFLDHLAAEHPEAAKNALELEALAGTLNALAKLSPAEIQRQLPDLMPDFQVLAVRLGFAQMPDMEDVRKQSQRMTIKHGRLFSAAQDFSAMIRIFEMVNELDLYIRKYASSETISSASDTFWSRLWGFKWIGHAFNKGTMGKRDAAVEAIMKFWNAEAFKRLGANKALRQEILELLRKGRHGDALAKLESLDPEAAQKALEEHQQDKLLEDPFENLEFDGFMTRSVDNIPLVKAQGVMTSLFGHFQPYMISYMGAGAGVDWVLSSAGIGLVGQIAKYAQQGASLMTTMARFERLSFDAGKIAQMSRMSRLIESISSVSKSPGIGTAMSWPKAWVHNLTTVAGASEMPRNLAPAQMALHAGRTFVLQNFPNAAKFTLTSMAIMGGASGGMQWVMHEASPETSQSKSGGEAFRTGAAGGVAFGAQAAGLFLVSPFPSTLFGPGRIGNVARALAETPGPVTGGIRFVAQLFKPSSAVAKMGPLGAIQTASMNASATLRILAGKAAWGTAMADGAAKYFLAAEVPGAIAGLGHFYLSSSKSQTGATPHVSRLARAQNFGLLTSQASWLFLPVNPMYSAKEIKAQAQSVAALNHFLKSGRGPEIERAREGDKIVEPHKPWHMKSVTTLWRGRAPLELTVSEQSRRFATEYRLRHEQPRAEIMALATGSSKDHGRVKPLSEMILGLAGSKTDKPLQGEAVDMGDRRITNESIAAAKQLQMKALRRDKVMREGILAAKDEYVFQDKSVGKVIVAGEKLEALKNLAAMEHIEASWAGLRSALGSAWTRVWDMLAGRRLELKYDRIVREVKGGIKAGGAEDIIVDAQGRMDIVIGSAGALDGLALSRVRRTIESDAYTRFVNDKLARDFQAYRDGRLGREGLNESAGLFVEVWEKGVFGQLFGSKEIVIENGKETAVYKIPPEYQRKDAHGRAITYFQPLQKTMVLDTLTAIGEGKRMIFDLLVTGGGKTLIGFALLSYMESYARHRGRRGTYYVTDKGESVAQVQEVYSAFFEGRKPSFEIITYSELMARQAQAEVMGTLSPFSTHDMVWDEAEEPSLKSALSLGQDNGAMSYTKVDPALAVLRGRSGLSPEMGFGVKEIWREGGIFDPKDARTSMDQNAFARKLRSDGLFHARFNQLVERTTAKLNEALRYSRSGQFRESIDPALYPGMTREQIFEAIGQQHRQGFGGFWKIGVVERQYGAFKNWVAELLEGSYLARSQKDLSKVFSVDKERGRIYMVHNDTVYENLDTVLRSGLELLMQDREGVGLMMQRMPELAQLLGEVSGLGGLEVPLTYKFTSVNITDYAKLNEAARDRGSLVIGLSGTLADGMIPFMAKEIGWHIQGKGTKLPEVSAVVLEGKTAGQALVEAILTVNKHNLGAKGPKDVVVTFADSEAKSQQFQDLLAAAGISPSRVSVAAYPGSNFASEKLLKGPEVDKKKNVEALSRGEIDVVILAGQDGLRGLDLSFAAYKDGNLSFYTPDPELAALVSQKQLFGRTYGDQRVPESTRKTYYLLAEAAALRANPTYLGLVERKLREASRHLDAQRWQEVAVLLKDKVASGKTLEESIAWILEDPMLFEARKAYMDYLTIGALRQYLGEAKLKEALENPETLKKVAVETEVFKILVWEMQRQAEWDALGSSGITQRR